MRGGGIAWVQCFHNAATMDLRMFKGAYRVVKRFQEVPRCINELLAQEEKKTQNERVLYGA